MRVFLICLTFALTVLFHRVHSEQFDNPAKNIFQSLKSVLTDVFGNFPVFLNKIGEALNEAIEEDCEYKCPNGKTPKYNPYYVPVGNGCGVPDFSIPKYISVERLEKCCNNHDICYGTCLKDKEKCDEKFKKCLYEICSSFKQIMSDERLNKACKGVAKTFYMAVLGVGCKCFLDAQKEACLCDSNYYNEL